ncbi:hypothetical protein [Pseudoalteromonas sp. bablab_jr011]|uniref:hypothetical protein n=1 Tax=Pseudoalteromonas sp. bablab_jr011 TaxID=2755062 RepID=UPI0018F3776A|nr:hypothetical protein [Pseudoalteromonas sp. bablab_jr011]
MAAFTAEQASINNGSKVVQINSGESIANIRSGDFLVLAGFIVEINRAFVGAANEQLIELVKAWSHSTQSNQPCIVIPTTAEFKTVIAALNEANALVNNNYKAMQDWQTKMGNVTFTNKDGTTTTVKTLKQIEADNAAQLDAYHPYPWAMRKVEFEARRAANTEKFAASGFVHFGKHNSDTESVNQGLSPRPLSKSENRLYLGRESILNVGGDSKSKTPVINISGVITKLRQDNSDGFSGAYSCPVKFPPEEDGTRTYDSATGTSVNHATAAIAFASETETNKVVTDRVDMWGFEAFLREINDPDPFVYEYGLIQSQATNINGVTTVSDNVRPVTYFAWYIGDTTSRGKGVNWQTATEAQRIAIAIDPKNNIYFDDATGKFYQWCVRGRSFAGAGNGDWNAIDTSTGSSANYLFFDAKYRPEVQGLADSASTLGEVGPLTYGTGNATGISLNAKSDIAIYTGRTVGNRAVNDECYFLVCGTASRLNKGAYHPFNPLGSSRLNSTVSSSAGRYWHQSEAIIPTNKADLFNPVDGGADNTSAGYTIGSGNINSGFSGREDGKLCDAIYSSGQGGVCRDMRYKASGLNDVDFAEADLSIKDGTYRGREFLNITQFLTETVTVSAPATYSLANNNTTSFSTSASDNPRNTTTFVFENKGATHWILVGDNNQAMVIKRVNFLSNYAAWPFSNNGAYLYGSGDITSEFNSKFPIDTKLWIGAYYPKDVEISHKYTQLDVIGAPLDILLCDDLKGGWSGGWISVIPDGTSKKFPLTRPLVEQLPLQSTTDAGVTWTNYNAWTSLAYFDSIKDEWSHSFPSNAVYLINYTTNALSCKPSSNYKPLGGLKGLGGVYVTAFADGDGGHANSGFFCQGLIGKRTTTKTTAAYPSTSMLTSVSIGSGGSLKLPLPIHTSISLGSASAQAVGVKALNYNLSDNQQGFINYAYTELKHNGTDWGDDGKVHIADNQTTMLDENGNTVLVGTARCVEPLGWIKNDK